MTTLHTAAGEKLDNFARRDAARRIGVDDFVQCLIIRVVPGAGCPRCHGEASAGRLYRRRDTHSDSSSGNDSATDASESANNTAACERTKKKSGNETSQVPNFTVPN